LGLKDWIAGNVAGPRAYGEALGRQTAMEGGRGLANSAFFSHGARPKESDASTDQVIFDTVSEMELAGFKHRYEETFRIVGALLSADEQLLYKSLHIGMTPFAYLVVSSIASSLMRRDNSEKFCSGLTEAASRAMADSGLYANHTAAKEALLSYVRSYETSSNPAILNLGKPASGDFLEHSLIRCIEVSGAQSQYAFVRTGTFRLNLIATTIWEETLTSILGATRQFRW
jgi:hypothetical protein